MKIKWTNIRIGLRTVKTAVAVLLSMALVDSYGISTSKLHAYGPMGVQELTTTKFVVFGQGQVRK